METWMSQNLSRGSDTLDDSTLIDYDKYAIAG